MTESFAPFRHLWYNRSRKVLYLSALRRRPVRAVGCLFAGQFPEKGGVTVRVRTYELMYIVDPTIGGDEEYAGIIDRINSALGNAGATISDGEALAPTGRRRLAYPIRHNGQDLAEGFYAFTRFDAQPQQIVTIERDIKLTEPVIRYLLTVVE